MPLAWFRRRTRRASPEAPPAPPTPRHAWIDAIVELDWPACGACGTALGEDPDDDPEGDAGAPLCGECNRARYFDEMEGR